MAEKTISLRTAYREAQEAAQEAMREACGMLAKAEQADDPTPEQLGSAIQTTAETLLHAGMHVDAMQSIQGLIDRGYRTVSVQRVNLD